MKFSRAPLALLSIATCTGAIAQSTATIYGTLDLTYQVGKGSVADVSQLTNSGLASSILGFRVREDLGGGLTAGAWLEGGLTPDNGAGVATNSNNQASGTAGGALNGGQGLTFNRYSLVQLFTPYGELRMGRQFIPQYRNLSAFDPFTSLGVGGTQLVRSIITAPYSTFLSNSIGYVLPPSAGGFYGDAALFLGENSSNAPNKDDGSGWGARLGWGTGPVSVAGATSKLKYVAGDLKQSNLAASYDFNVAKAMAVISRDSNGRVNARGWLAGITVPVGAGQFRASYAAYRTDAVRNPETKKLALGYVHNLSKRTALYATWAKLRNSGGATQALGNAVTGPDRSSSGYDLGLRHSF